MRVQRYGVSTDKSFHKNPRFWTIWEQKFANSKNISTFADEKRNDMVTTRFQADNSEFATVNAGNVENDRHVIDHGAIIYCYNGSAMIKVNFDDIVIKSDNVLTLFPGDTVSWTTTSSDFHGEVLRYSSPLLREASLNIEQAVFRELKADRICNDTRIAIHVGRTMFDLLRYYFGELHSKSIDRIVMLQLSTFFLGFYDFISAVHPHRNRKDTSRTEELFRQFMELIEEHYREWHEVGDYADEMFITRKYLGLIVTKKTQITPKRLIDEYIILQLKLRLRSTKMTLQQIAAEFHFTDMSFFSRYFKAHTGVTPAQWAKGGK